MTNFRWEEGLFGPIEAATEFDAASYFARSPSCIALARATDLNPPMLEIARASARKPKSQYVGKAESFGCRGFICRQSPTMAHAAPVDLHLRALGSG